MLIILIHLTLSKFLLDQKLWHRTQFLSFPGFINFLRKITTHKWPFYDHFWPFFANYMNNFHKTEVRSVILRCIVCLNLNWIKSNNTILVKTYFFHAWKCIISGLVCQSKFWHLLEFQLSYFQNVCFSKILWGFHKTHNQVKCR